MAMRTPSVLVVVLTLVACVNAELDNATVPEGRWPEEDGGRNGDAPHPTACEMEAPCGINAVCLPDKRVPESKYKCECERGFKGNPYAGRKGTCRSKQLIYLERLFGYTGSCHGCKHIRPFLKLFTKFFPEADAMSVLDLGSGGCKAMQTFVSLDVNATGVEVVEFPLEEHCPELLNSSRVMQAPFNSLPFGNNTFDVVFVSHVFEYLPIEILDDVIAEVSRVARLHVFLAIKTLHSKAHYKTNVLDGLKLESFYPNLWWRERLAAASLDVMEVATQMYMIKVRKRKIKMEKQEVVMVLAKTPREGSRAFEVIHQTNCFACDYMPLVSYMFSPPMLVSRSSLRHDLRMGNTLIMGPSACNVMRGLLESPPSTLTQALAFQPVEYTIVRDCPDLMRQRAVLLLPPVGAGIPVARGETDLVLSLFHLELLTVPEIEAHIREIKRIMKARTLFLIHACGIQNKDPNCLAKAIPGAVTIQPRAWWLDLLERQGFEIESFAHVFQKRPCTLRNKQTDARRRGYCNSIMDELSAAAQFEIKQHDIFPVVLAQEGTDDVAEAVEAHHVGVTTTVKLTSMVDIQAWLRRREEEAAMEKRLEEEEAMYQRQSGDPDHTQALGEPGEGDDDENATDALIPTRMADSLRRRGYSLFSD